MILDPTDPYDLFYRLQSAGQPGDTDMHWTAVLERFHQWWRIRRSS